VRREYERKYEGACPANEELRCLAYLAEHTSSPYGLQVMLRRGAHAKTWEWVASLGAYDGTVLPQPDVFPFTDTGDIVFDKICEQTLTRYVELLNLKALPIVPTKVTTGPKTGPTGPTAGTGPKETTPVEMVHPYGTAGLITAGVGAATAIVGGVVLASGASQAGGLGIQNGNVPVGNAEAAAGVMSQGTVGSVLVGVGAAVAVGGLVMGMIETPAPTKAEKKVKLMMVPTAGGAVLSISGSLP